MVRQAAASFAASRPSRNCGARWRSRASFIWRDSGFETAFGLHAARIAAQVEACAKEDIPPLAAAFGPAEIDKAILDALLRGVGVNFFDGMAAEYRRDRCASVARSAR